MVEICTCQERKKLPAWMLPKWLPSELTCLNRDFGIHIASPTVAVDHVAINCQLSLKMNDFRSLQIAVCVDAPGVCQGSGSSSVMKCQKDTYSGIWEGAQMQAVSVEGDRQPSREAQGFV